MKTLLRLWARNITQANWEASAAGIEFMDTALKTLKAAIEAIRDTAIKALSQIEQPQEEHSMRWKCKGCQYIKHFTKPVPLETTGRCPRCKSTEFRPVLLGEHRETILGDHRR
jgi:Zn finger protein HypA/HybF involved in hydrogenase expression